MSRGRSRRTALLAALGGMGLLGACVVLFGLGAAEWAIVAWIAGNLALGAVLALTSGGRAAWAPVAVGVAIAAVVGGLATAVISAVTGLPNQGEPAPLPLLAAVVAMAVAIFGEPVALAGAVSGSAFVDVRSEWRHRRVAAGKAALQRPAAELISRSEATRPLDALGLAKATADGAATTLVRRYALDASPDSMLAADGARLAEAGYALTSTETRPGRSGTGWRLLEAAATGLDPLSLGSVGSLELGERVHEARRGYLVATFVLRSPDHAPLPSPDPFGRLGPVSQGWPPPAIAPAGPTRRRRAAFLASAVGVLIVGFAAWILLQPSGPGPAPAI